MVHMSTVAVMAPARPVPGRTGLSGAVSNLFVLVALLGFQAYAVAAGLPVGRLLLALAAVAVTQILPGALLWRTIRPRDGWLLEDLGMGFAMGICLAVPAQIVAGLLQSRWPAILLPLLFAAVLLAVPVTRRRILDAQWSPVPWWFGGGIAVCTLGFVTQLMDYYRTNRLDWAAGPGQPHVDTYLHIALASELLERGPVEWPTVQGGTLGYQWFAHAWIAHVSAVSGAGLDQVTMRFLPALIPVVGLVTVATLGLRLSRSPGVGVLAVAGTVFLGNSTPFAIADAALPLTPLSPTVGLALPPLMAFIAVLAMRWRGQAQRGAWLAIPLLTCISTGIKGSAAPIVVAGIALAILAMLIWNRRMVLPLVLDIVAIGVTLGLTMIVVYRGSAAGLQVNPAEAASQTPLGRALGMSLTEPGTTKMQAAALAMAFAAGMSRALFTFALPFRRTDRRDPLTWVLLGSAIAGAAPVVIFYHPGASQYYFLMTAIPLAAVGSALGVWRLYHALTVRSRWLALGFGVVGGALFFTLPARLTGGHLRAHQLGHAVTMVAIGALIVVLCGIAALLLADRRRVVTGLTAATAVVVLGGAFAAGTAQQHSLPVPPVPAPVALTDFGATSNGQLDAARFIRDHSGVDDLVMTNRHCAKPTSDPDNCDKRRWLVTAFTQRQSMIESWTATPEATNIAPHGRESVTLPYWDPALLQLNDGFYTHPSAAAQRELWDRGVRWVYVDNTIPHAGSLAPYATLRYANQDASAWQLNAPSS